jgi:hypothetical protein
MTGNELPFLAQYMYAMYASFPRHWLAAEQAAHRRDLIHHHFRAIYCVRCRGPIYRARGVGMGNTLVTQKPLSCPDMLTNFTSRVINRVCTDWKTLLNKRSNILDGVIASSSFSENWSNIKNFVPLSPLLSLPQSFTILMYRQKKSDKSKDTAC